MLLYRDIGEVYKHIVQFTDTGIVLDCAEPAEPQPVPGGEVGRGREGEDGEKDREVQMWEGRGGEGERERRERRRGREGEEGEEDREVQMWEGRGGEERKGRNER